MSDEHSPIPADLLRQLTNIEREANEMSAGALVQEAFDWPRFRGRRSRIRPRSTPYAPSSAARTVRQRACVMCRFG